VACAWAATTPGRYNTRPIRHSVGRKVASETNIAESCDRNTRAVLIAVESGVAMGNTAVVVRLNPARIELDRFFVIDLGAMRASISSSRYLPIMAYRIE
jgi:hypothetical protein